MDKEIVSFIKSIEPDYSYQGSTGMLYTVLEANENMLAIDNYINSISISEEACNESFSDKVANIKAAADKKVSAIKNTDYKAKFKAAKDLIIKSIRRAIEKIKSLFFTSYKKLQILYTKALEKVSALLTKLGTSQNTTIKYEFENLDSGELNKIINSYNSRNITTAEDLKTKVETDSPAQNASDDDIESADALIRNALAGTPGELTIKEVMNLKATLKEKCFSKFNQINIGKSQLKVYFDDSVAGPLKLMYKNILENEQAVLKMVHSLEDDGKHGEVAIKKANKLSMALQGANIKFFDAVLGAATTGLSNYVRAIIAAAKANAGAKASNVADKAKDAKENAKIYKDTAVEFAKGAYTKATYPKEPKVK